MDAKTARRILLRQHDRIRVHLGACTVLACRFREGESVLDELDEALDQLRTDLMEHNVTEAALVDEQHIAEHAAFWELLVGSAVDVVLRIDDLVDELDAHMAGEEKTFLSMTGARPAPPTAAHANAARYRW